MKASEIHGKSVEELQQELNVQLEKQFKQRMQRSTGQLDKSHVIKETRRAIARIKTVLNQKAVN